MFYLSTKQTWLVIVFSILILATSIWYGGTERWHQLGWDFSDPDSQKLSSELEVMVKENPQSPVLKYNLANIYHHQSSYEKAKSLLLEVLNNHELDKEIIERTLFNLGNNLFQLGVKEQNLQTALGILQESLTYYRDLIDRQRRLATINGKGDEIDPDLLYNATVVRQRIKLIMDKIRKQEQKKEGEKTVYQILQTLFNKELELKQQLLALESDNNLPDRNTKRDQLLSEREKITAEITLLKNKLLKQLKDIPKSSPPVI